MSSSILYEPSSTRDDHGIWVLTHGQAVQYPFHISWRGRTKGGEYIDFNISSECYVVFRIKEFLVGKPILIKSVDMGTNNTVELSLTRTDMILLKGGKTYHLTVELFDNAGNQMRILIRDLPMRILESGVDYE